MHILNFIFYLNIGVHFIFYIQGVALKTGYWYHPGSEVNTELHPGTEGTTYPVPVYI